MSARAVCLCTLLLAGCAAPAPSVMAVGRVDAEAIEAGLPPSDLQPPPLVPQPEGTPLPPRDPRIALRWPPEIRQVVDDMLALFSKDPDSPGRPIAEIEQRMRLKLVHRLSEPLGSSKLRHFDVVGTRFADSQLQRVGIGESYTELGHFQILTLVVGPRTTGYCLDPYELAVYTGDAYVNGDTSVHMPVKRWPPASVWGMFEWSNVGMYLGNALAVRVSKPSESTANDELRLCVITIGGSGFFNKEGGN